MNRNAGRRRLLQAFALLPFAGMSGVACSGRRGCAEWSAAHGWPEWKAFLALHAQHDGRIIDFANTDLRSTSESQSYAMFFALVADDRALFESAYGWMQRELAGGRLGQVLPAWLWGRDDSGDWRVLDDNNATDADLWTAYALLEAARLWDRPDYLGTARALLALVREHCVTTLPGFGPMLMPGRHGFARSDSWTINPSYMPLPVLRRLHAFEPEAGWDAIAERTVAMLERCTPEGFAPDWTRWDGEAFVPDPKYGPVGSYDAIRVYLWAGVTHAEDPLFARLQARLGGPVSMLRSAGGRLPEHINTAVGTGKGEGPPGYAAALLPYLAARGEHDLVEAQRALIPAIGTPAGDRLPYYERMLLLFGAGWADGRYRFEANGQLVPAWSTQCRSGR